MKAKFSERKYRILDFLHRRPGAKFGEIERAMGVRINTTLSRLERQGLVRGEVEVLKPSGGRGDPPRWVKRYRLTRKGLERKKFLAKLFEK